MQYCDVKTLLTRAEIGKHSGYWDNRTANICKFFDYKLQDGYIWKFTSDGATYVMDYNMELCHAKVTDKLIELYATPYKVAMVTKNCVALGDRMEQAQFGRLYHLCMKLFNYNRADVKDPDPPVVGSYLHIDGYGLATCFDKTIYVDRENCTMYSDLDTSIKEPVVMVRKLDMKKVRDARKDYNLAMASFVGLYQMGAFKSQGWPSYEEWQSTISKYDYDDVVECKPFWWMKLMNENSRVSTRITYDAVMNRQGIYLTNYYWSSDMYKFEDSNPQKYVDTFWRNHKEMVYERVGANQVKLISVREHLNVKDEDDSAGDTADTA